MSGGGFIEGRKRTSGDGYDPLKFNAGLDAKVGISSDYTLDLSINPDFGQVEADPPISASRCNTP